MKFQIKLPATGKPIESVIVEAPLFNKYREIDLYLPHNCYGLMNYYKLCFIDENGDIIGPYSNSQMVDFGRLSGGKITVKAVLDREYRIQINNCINSVINANGILTPFEVTYNYEGIIDIDAYNLAMSTCTFSSEQLLTDRASLIMEQVLRAVITQIISQNPSNAGGVSSQLLYNLETVVASAVSSTFNEACNNYLIWCRPVGCLRLQNTNMAQILDNMNIPIQIERMRQQQLFDSDKRIKEITTKSLFELKKENIRAISQMGMTGAYPVNDLLKLL